MALIQANDIVEIPTHHAARAVIGGETETTDDRELLWEKAALDPPGQIQFQVNQLLGPLKFPVRLLQLGRLLDQTAVGFLELLVDPLQLGALIRHAAIQFPDAQKGLNLSDQLRRLERTQQVCVGAGVQAVQAILSGIKNKEQRGKPFGKSGAYTPAKLPDGLSERLRVDDDQLEGREIGTPSRFQVHAADLMAGLFQYLAHFPAFGQIGETEQNMGRMNHTQVRFSRRRIGCFPWHHWSRNGHLPRRNTVCARRAHGRFIRLRRGGTERRSGIQ